ncbi:MAG: flagellar export protein FliJ [Fimbriimonadales bacterium]|nr:flagellar export protein FliJ [Fimbriimonadales bacterium]
MRRFRFRLQKVLEHRERLEEEAKTAFLNARAQRLEAERRLEELRTQRAEWLSRSFGTLTDRLALERFLDALDGRERDQRIVIATLEDEEESLRRAWIDARRDAEAMRRLRQAAFDEWRTEADRREQADLDEWAVLRRTA